MANWQLSESFHYIRGDLRYLRLSPNEPNVRIDIVPPPHIAEAVLLQLLEARELLARRWYELSWIIADLAIFHIGWSWILRAASLTEYEVLCDSQLPMALFRHDLK